MIETQTLFDIEQGLGIGVCIENGRWARLSGGSSTYGKWEAALVAPDDGFGGWTVNVRSQCSETFEWKEASILGKGLDLKYEAAQNLAMGYMCDPSGTFEFFEGNPYLLHRSDDAFYAEALPQSKIKRDLSVRQAAVGNWTAFCGVSFWDEEHQYFMMRHLEIEIGFDNGWRRDQAVRHGLHWLVNGSFLGRSCSSELESQRILKC